MSCKHENFTATVNVNRLTKSDDGVDAQELRAPIRPKGCKIMPAIPGFTVMAN